jgi:hypothetical protein
MYYMVVAFTIHFFGRSFLHSSKNGSFRQVDTLGTLHGLFRCRIKGTGKEFTFALGGSIEFGTRILTDAPHLILMFGAWSFQRCGTDQSVSRPMANSIGIKEFSGNTRKLTFDIGTILTWIATIGFISMLTFRAGHIFGGERGTGQ